MTSQAKAAAKHAARPRVRPREPGARAKVEADAAAERDAAGHLGQYARRIAPAPTAHWSQHSIDLAQVIGLDWSGCRRGGERCWLAIEGNACK